MASEVRQEPRVLLVGTDPDGKGGISTVARQYLDYGVFGYRIRHVSTHSDKSRSAKLLAAALGITSCWIAFLRNQADLVHVLVSSGASFWRKLLVSSLARLLGVPVVVHIHGSDFGNYISSASQARKLAARILLSRAQKVVVLGGEMRAAVLAVAPSADLETLPNAVPVPKQGASYSSDGGARIVAIGRLGARKGTPELVEAFAKCDRTGAKLILAGDGDIGGTIILAEQLGVEDRVEVVGWVDPLERDSLLRSATVFALPSRAEGLPMALLEAMAIGVPAVVTPVGAILDVIVDRKNGLVVEAGDELGLRMAIQELMDDVILREQLGKSGRETIRESYSIDRILGDLGQIWGSVLSRR